MLRKVLLACGIGAPVLSVATDSVATLRSAGYSALSQSSSELSGIGAPTRPLVLPLSLAADLLLIAFGVGVWRSARGKVAPRLLGGLLIGSAVANFVGTAFFPMDLSQAAQAARNTRTVIAGAVGVIAFVLAIGCGAAAFRRWFRVYSIATLLTFIVLGILGVVRPLQSPAEAHVSLVGVQERTMAYGYLLWVAVLAIHLLRRPGEQTHGSAELPGEMPRSFASKAVA